MFTNVASLYNAAPLPIPIRVQDVVMLLRYDRVEMLDVYIRRTGLGIDIDIDIDMQKDPEERQGGRNDKNRVYLGLSVHGKKMAGLARTNDPNAKIGTQGLAHCLLWRAAEERATAIVEYLAGDRPRGVPPLRYSWRGRTRLSAPARSRPREGPPPMAGVEDLRVGRFAAHGGGHRREPGCDQGSVR
ncbi:hypothetical protein D9615_009599 [Tricholomella constricta]|uniref:Uncharacterized protein n=1 Tax=Tricholomella constricta TaxID=117010 RepID=A0A8H5GV29_9AGAR|nr:hypothetical protein D9615_009599 [Tricholomella constricta]